MKSIVKMFCLLVVVASVTIGRTAAAEFSDATIQAKAPEVRETILTPNIMKGSTSIGGGFGVVYSTYSSLILDVYPTVEHFVADRFSVGGSMQMSLSKFNENLSIGPSATYYFWQEQNWATFVGAGLLFSHARRLPSDSIQDGWITNMHLGLNYFFDPAVAFGPNLTISRYISNSGLDGNAYGTLLFKLSVFL